MESNNSRNAKILIAEENASLRQSLRDDLYRFGFRGIEEASNGEEALIKIGRTHPDIAIIDVWLSKIDGIGVLRNIRSLDFGKDKEPSFIVLSAVANQSILLEATNSGAELCLPLPYDSESLCRHIERILESKTGSSQSAKSISIRASEPDIETQVTQIIHQIGVPAHIKGYQYLRTAILLTIDDSDIINSVTKSFIRRSQRSIQQRPRGSNAR